MAEADPVRSAAVARAASFYGSARNQAFGPGSFGGRTRAPVTYKPPQYPKGWSGEGRERPATKYEGRQETRGPRVLRSPSPQRNAYIQHRPERA